MDVYPASLAFTLTFQPQHVLDAHNSAVSVLTQAHVPRACPDTFSSLQIPHVANVSRVVTLATLRLTALAA